MREMYTSPRESPIPAKTDFADPVQDHMLFIIIDAHFMLSACQYVACTLIAWTSSYSASDSQDLSSM